MRKAVSLKPKPSGGVSAIHAYHQVHTLYIVVVNLAQFLRPLLVGRQLIESN